MLDLSIMSWELEKATEYIAEQLAKGDQTMIEAFEELKYKIECIDHRRERLAKRLGE
jgi:hypothetical protein